MANAKAAQFYDRDTNPEMATEGMKGFQEFMVYPSRMDNILQRLDKIEERVFKEQAKGDRVRKSRENRQAGIAWTGMPEDVVVRGKMNPSRTKLVHPARRSNAD